MDSHTTVHINSTHVHILYTHTEAILIISVVGQAFRQSNGGERERMNSLNNSAFFYKKKMPESRFV